MRESWAERWTPRSLSGRLTLAIALVLAAYTTVIAVSDAHQRRANAVRNEGLRNRAIASTVLSGRRLEGFARACDAQPFLDAVSDWAAAPPPVREVHELLRACVAANGLSSPVYVLVLRPEFEARVRAEPDRLHENAMEFLATSAEQPYWRHRYEYRPEMRAALFGGRAASTGVYGDSHGHWVSAYAPLRGMSQPALVEVDSPLDALLASVEAESRWVSVSALIAFIVFLVSLRGIVRRATASLRQLCERARRFGEGDFDSPIPTAGTVEIGELSAALDAARASIGAGAQRNQQLLSELQASLGQSNSASGVLRDGAERQARSLHNLDRLMAEVGDTTATIATDAAETLTLSRSSEQAASTGQREVEEMGAAMGAIEQSSERISTVLRAIDDIAFQTNLLALNAAVEAARAGAAGRGFGVVASEVRNLAARSAAAAKETAGLLDEARQRAQHGVEVAQRLRAVFLQVAESVHSVNALIGRIDDGCQGQHQGFGVVRDEIRELRAIMLSIAEHAHELSSSSEASRAQVESLRAAAASVGSEHEHGVGVAEDVAVGQ